MVKIMLVDDETSFSATLGERLQLRGFDVCLAETGEQAISMMAHEAPQVVMMDLSLPDMSGLEVMEKMKKIDSALEVIVLSGHGAEYRHEALARGAFNYVMKPFKLVYLVELISRAIEHRTALKGV
nr:response regulator [Desulfobulbaceae bacterium]